MQPVLYDDKQYNQHSRYQPIIINMAAVAQAANLIEKALGHGDNAVTEQNVTNPGRDREKYADPSGEKMKALIWMGKNTVEVGQSHRPHSIFPPAPLLLPR